MNSAPKMVPLSDTSHSTTKETLDFVLFFKAFSEENVLIIPCGYFSATLLLAFHFSVSHEGMQSTLKAHEFWKKRRMVSRKDSPSPVHSSWEFEF